MPQLKVIQEVDGKPADIFKKLRAYCDKKLILKQMGNLKPTVAWDAKKRIGHFSEKGVDGTITVTSNSPCSITVTMKIPFLMLPIKSLLKESIQSHLDHFV